MHAGANLIHGGQPLQVTETVKALESVTGDKLKAVSALLRRSVFDAVLTKLQQAAKTLLEGKASVAAVGDLHVLPFAEELGLKV